MSKRMIYIISIFFITLLLAKGIGSAVPFFFSGDNDTIQIELLAESEPEEKKNNGSKSFETNPAEELFDHSFYTSSLTDIQTAISIQACSTTNFLPHVCLDIPTPPPNQVSIS